MIIGKLNKRIKLYNYTQGQDEGFGAAYNWNMVAEVWAEILRPRFTTGTMNGSADATLLTQGINIRKRLVEKGWRVEYNGDMYEVLHVDNSQPDFLTLTCRSVEVKT